MRALALLALLLGGLAAAAPSAPDPGPPQLALFFAPPDAPESVLLARDALAARARRAGIAWIDLTPPAEARPSAPALLRSGIDAYDALRHDDALALLDRAAEEIARSGGAGLDAAGLSDLFLYRGLTYTQMGDATRAWDDLVRAATLDPARVLDPLRFPTRAVEAFERARAEVAKLARGTLRVDVPAGCSVVVDGAAAPGGRVALPYGDHYLRVECAGHRPFGARVALASPEQPLRPELTPIAPPEEPALLELARGRGARVVALLRAHVDGGAPPTLSLRRLAVDDGRTLGETSVTLTPGGGATPDAEAAWDRLIAPPVPVGPVKPPAKTRWYKKPWVWAIAGAAAATAVLLPIALSGGDDPGVVLAPKVPGW